jgi:hypothetical protein
MITIIALMFSTMIVAENRAFKPELQISIQHELDPDYSGPGHAPAMVFSEETIRARITIYYSHTATLFNSEATSSAKASRVSVPDLVFKASRITDRVEISLVDETGAVVEKLDTSKAQVRWERRQSGRKEAISGFRLLNGEAVSLTIEAVNPGQGDYALRASLFDDSNKILDSAEAAISCRNGDESKQISRAYYFFRAKRESVFDGYRKWMLKAVQENPNDFYALEELADASIDKVESETTIQYYRQASEARMRGLAAYKEANAGVVPDHVQQLVDEDLQRLAVFEKLAKYYRSSVKNDVALRAAYVRGRKWFAWVDKGTGRFIGEVDPTHPERGQHRQPQR